MKFAACMKSMMVWLLKHVWSMKVCKESIIRYVWHTDTDTHTYIVWSYDCYEAWKCVKNISSFISRITSSCMNCGHPWFTSWYEEIRLCELIYNSYSYQFNYRVWISRCCMNSGQRDVFSHSGVVSVCVWMYIYVWRWWYTTYSDNFWNTPSYVFLIIPLYEVS